MKNRIFAATFAMFIIVSVFTTVSFAGEGKRVVYVDGYGQSSKGDGSEENPFAKLSLAIADLKDTGGEIVLLSDIDLVNEYKGELPDITYDLTLNLVNPEHSKCITIRSKEPADRKIIRFSVTRTSATWTMGGPTIFENIYFSFGEKDEVGNSYSYKRIYSNGYPLVMGEGCDSGSSTYFHTGVSPYETKERESDPENDFIVFKSGSWSFLFGPSTEYTKGRADYAYYILGDATVSGYIAVGPLGRIFTDRARLYVNTTGSVKTIHSAYTIGKGDVDVYLDKGTITSVQSKSLEGGTGGIFSCYLSGAKVTGKIDGDPAGTMEETRFFYSGSVNVESKAPDFDIAENTYEYSEEPYKAIEKKIEELKADFLTEKPASESDKEKQEDKEGDEETEKVNVSDELIDPDESDALKEFSDKNAVWLIPTACISVILMFFITFKKVFIK